MGELSSGSGEASPDAAGRGVTTRVADTIPSLVAVVPTSLEAAQNAPRERAEWLTRRAARAAAGISASAALVPGPFGVWSLLPDIYGVWKVQAQLVSGDRRAGDLLHHPVVQGGGAPVLDRSLDRNRWARLAHGEGGTHRRLRSPRRAPR